MYDVRKYEGKQYYKWTVIKYDHTKKVKTKHGIQPIHYFVVRCDCGSEFIRHLADIKSGKSKCCKSCSSKIRMKKLQFRWSGKTSPNWKGTKDIPRAAYTKHKYGAKVRGIEFDLTIEDLQNQWDKQKGRCTYTNRALIFNNKSFKTKNTGKVYNFASLDRIDSEKSYTIDNIQWVCQAANIAKQQYKHEEFLELIKDIYLFMFK